MTDATKYSVFAIKIATPHDRRLMVSGLTEDDVKAYVYTPVMRRGVYVEYFKSEPEEPK